jgi:hypothetical protein
VLLCSHAMHYMFSSELLKDRNALEYCRHVSALEAIVNVY